MKLTRSNGSKAEVRGSLPSTHTEALVSQWLSVDPQTLRRVGSAAKYVEPKKMKRAFLALAGGAALLSLLGKLERSRAYHRAVAKELKRQLEPINRKLETLETQNESLRQQNEELKRQLENA